ncbi:MAG: hypothetical protein GEV11_10080 [Streptosporangiales bacterium]|nr:hypothetical protein [Streptosporangiales bacterium]
MSVLTYLILPVLVTLIAAIAVYLRGRPGRGDDNYAAVRDFQRFRSALGAQTGSADSEDAPHDGSGARRIQ